MIRILEIDRLREENKRLKKALAFYANDENYEPVFDALGGCGDPDCCAYSFSSPIENDGGDIARKALQLDLVGINLLKN